MVMYRFFTVTWHTPTNESSTMCQTRWPTLRWQMKWDIQTNMPFYLSRVLSQAAKRCLENKHSWMQTLNNSCVLTFAISFHLLSLFPLFRVVRLITKCVRTVNEVSDIVATRPVCGPRVCKGQGLLNFANILLTALFM